MTSLSVVLRSALVVLLVVLAVAGVRAQDQEETLNAVQIDAPEMRDVQYVDDLAQAMGLVEVSHSPQSTAASGSEFLHHEGSCVTVAALAYCSSSPSSFSPWLDLVDVLPGG